MTDNGNITHFDPSDHIKEIKTKDGLKPYLDPRKATTWFYHDHPAPSGKIITNVIRMEPTILVRAEVWIDGELVATGHADPDGNSTTLKKIESSAIRRALANAGYGTDQAVKQIAKAMGVEAGKELLGSGKSNGERKMGQQQNHKLPDLKAWALKNVYDNNEYHMEASIKKLIEEGKLSPVLALEDAKNVVLNRHSNEMEANQSPNPYSNGEKATV